VSAPAPDPAVEVCGLYAVVVSLGRGAYAAGVVAPCRARWLVYARGFADRSEALAHAGRAAARYPRAWLARPRPPETAAP
jgi:hypothetical protein